MQSKKIIGTKYLTYAERRNIALSFPNYEVSRCMDLYVYLSAAHLRLTGGVKQSWFYHHDDFGLGNYVGFHFWNAASASHKPWVTTLELPCTDNNRLKYFASKQCRKMFCLSSWVMNYQRLFLEKSPYRDDILPKLQLLHPPQEINIDEKSLIKKEIQPLRFIFVGRDFFRKGGYECVKAFTKILESGFDAELIIVSKMDTNDYPLTASQEELVHALELIEHSGGKITIFKELSHKEVLRLISSSDVGLLPTYNDSYGYSVLEFFSYGLPVVTTNVYAQTEINSPERGWILEMPLIEAEYGEKKIDRDSLEKRKKMSILLTNILHECFCSILKNPPIVKTKALAAINYITENHKTSRNISILQETYDRF